MTANQAFTDEELRVLDDPYTSTWLKDQVRSWHAQEPKASAHDAEILANLQALRCLRNGISRRGQ